MTRIDGIGNTARAAGAVIRRPGLWVTAARQACLDLQEEAADVGHDQSIADLQKIQSSGKHLLELINGVPSTDDDGP